MAGDVVQKRDYRLTGPESARATERGLTSATWYRCAVPRSTMRDLMQRRDDRAIRDTAIWLVLLLVSGVLGFVLRGSLWCLPAFAVYGVLYGTVGDSRWHEAGHGTAFKTPWMNTVVYHLGSFMVTREPVSWRWSHARHHSDTIIVGRDPEIAAKRPSPIRSVLWACTGVPGVYAEFRKYLSAAVGRIPVDVADYVPASEHKKVLRAARLHLGVWVVSIGTSLIVRSPLPLVYVGLPTFYGRWLGVVYGFTQHAGLAEDVLDHRLNCRTVRMNRVNRFLYWNMNYHVEHHMFPTVPYHQLPALHDAVRADMPEPYAGIFDAYREIIPTLRRQCRDVTHYVHRPLPVQPSGVTQS